MERMILIVVVWAVFVSVGCASAAKPEAILPSLPTATRGPVPTQVVLGTSTPMPTPTSRPTPTFTPVPTPVSQMNMFQCRYWNNPNWSGDPVFVRNEEFPFRHNWGHGSPDDRLVNSDYFSLRCAGDFEIEREGTYRLHALTDDGMKVCVNQKCIIEALRPQGVTAYTADIFLKKGLNKIEVWYFEVTGGAIAELAWFLGEVQAAPPTVVPVAPPSRVAPTAVPTLTPSPTARLVASGSEQTVLFRNNMVGFSVTLPAKVYEDDRVRVCFKFGRNGGEVGKSGGLTIMVRKAGQEFGECSWFDYDGGEQVQPIFSASSAAETGCFDKVTAHIFRKQKGVDQWQGEQILVGGNCERGGGFAVKNPVVVGDPTYNERKGKITVSATNADSKTQVVVPMLTCASSGYTAVFWIELLQEEIANGSSFQMRQGSTDIQARISGFSDQSKIRSCALSVR